MYQVPHSTNFAISLEEVIPKLIKYHGFVMLLLLIITAESPIIFIWFFIPILTDNILLILSMIGIIRVFKKQMNRISLIPLYIIMLMTSIIISFAVSFLMPMLFHRPYTIFLMRFGATLCALFSVTGLVSSYGHAIPLLERGLCLMVCVAVFVLTR